MSEASAASAPEAEQPQPSTIVSYKGFGPDWKCRGFQYEMGQTYEHKGRIAACSEGFHACEYPLDVLAYYPAAGSRFAQVEQSGTLDKHADDSKVASSRISIKAELDLPGLIKAAIEYTVSRCKPVDPTSPAFNSGDRGAATNSGYSGAATNSGDRGAATNSGDRGAATNSGDSGAATNSGYSGAATNSGYSGAATNSGDSGAATNSGQHGIAADFNGWGRVQSCASGAIFLVRRSINDGAILHVFASKVGENGIKPDAWYELDEEGKPQEVQP